MLTPPVDLSEGELVAAVGRGWGVAVASMGYRAVGFGSHHWAAVDVHSERWFVTVDELECKRHSQGESEDAGFQRLRAALHTARDLWDKGGTYVVAPILTPDGEPLVRLEGGWAVAVYPYVEGDSFSWGEFSTPAHRRGIFDLIVELHAVPPAASRSALVDDFEIAHRDELELVLHVHDEVWDSGPYGALTSALIVENGEAVQRALRRYDDLLKGSRGQTGPMVLTHGEPHPGNTMLRAEGWCPIDWDTVLVAPPERDLWMLDPGDGSITSAYTAATGITPLPAMLDLYRLRWDLTEIALFVRQFRGQHSGTADDEKSWDGLCTLMARLAAWWSP